MNEAIFEPQSHVSPRLVLAIVIAMVLHGLVVLGVRLPAELPVKSRFAAMEVVLVPATIPASGDASASTSAEALTASVVAQEPPLLTAPPVERPPVKAATVTVAKPTPIKPTPIKPAPSKPAPSKSAPPVVSAPATPVAPAEVKVTPPVESLAPTAAQLIERSMTIAASGAGLIEQKTVSGQSLAERTHYIKNNTRDFAEITYKAEVRDRIKRFGGLYQRPVPAGTVTVRLAIGIDGALLDAHIVKSSHVAATDEEAMRIVNLAAPFAPVWPERARISDAIGFDQPINIEQDGGFSHGQ